MSHASRPRINLGRATGSKSEYEHSAASGTKLPNGDGAAPEYLLGSEGERGRSERERVRLEAWWADRRSTSRGCLEETKSLCCDEKWPVEEKQRLRLRPRWMHARAQATFAYANKKRLVSAIKAAGLCRSSYGQYTHARTHTRAAIYSAKH